MYVVFLQYIRVMASGAQCAENGPFFPPTSGYIIQNGISVASDILKTPDWEIIFILLGTAFMAMVLMLLALVSEELGKLQGKIFVRVKLYKYKTFDLQPLQLLL